MQIILSKDELKSALITYLVNERGIKESCYDMKIILKYNGEVDHLKVDFENGKGGTESDS